MKTSKKIYLTILLAITVVFLFGFSGPHWKEQIVVIDPPHNPEFVPDLDWYQRAFSAYNKAYFHGRLNTPNFVVAELSDTMLEASTECKENGTNCTVAFAPRYNQAPREAAQHVLHEMCHIKTWTDDQGAIILSADDLTRHGKHWRGCMIDLDNSGAFRQLIIDFYHGAEN